MAEAVVEGVLPEVVDVEALAHEAAVTVEVVATAEGMEVGSAALEVVEVASVGDSEAVEDEDSRRTDALHPRNCYTTWTIGDRPIKFVSFTRLLLHVERVPTSSLREWLRG